MARTRTDRCGICKLPWRICEPHCVPLASNKGVYYVCEDCFKKAQRSKVMEVATKYWHAHNRKHNNLHEEFPFEEVLKTVAIDYIKQHEQKDNLPKTGIVQERGSEI